MLNHINGAALPGGFVGVDVFFVISGFVVTRSIVATETHHVLADMAQFWRRRFFRIFPVLALMVLTTLTFQALFTPHFPPEAYGENTRTGLAALAGVGNLYLYRIGLDYFQNVSINPFVHTWSLGVEEQFYLAYSLVFIGLGFLFTKTRMLATARAATVSVLGAASIALFLGVANAHPMESYYFLPTRFWELAVGALLSIASDQFDWSWKTGPRLAGAAQLVGLALILASAAWASTGGYPVWPILAAVAGAALLIGAGAVKQALVSRGLSMGPLVYLGTLSYSLYLWHYPVIVLMRGTVGLDGAAQIAVALALTFALSVVSFRTVETTWRRSANRRFVRIAPYLAGTLVAIAAIFVGEHFGAGVPYLGRPQAWATLWYPGRDHAYAGSITADRCMLGDGDFRAPELPAGCIATPAAGGESAATPLVLVIGDSFGQASWGMVAHGQAAGVLRFATLVHSGCPIDWPPRAQSASCAHYWAGAPQLIRQTVRRGDVVFVGILWSSSPDPVVWSRLAAQAAAAQAVGADLVVQAPIPYFATPTYLCTPEWFRLSYGGCTADWRSMQARASPVLAKLQSLKTAYPNVVVWDPSPTLCPEATCSMFQQGKPIYRDGLHLSYYEAQALGPAFEALLRSLARPPASMTR